MAGRLAGKVALIVGAGQTPGETIGNGRATSIRFAEEGATVLLADKRIASAQETLAMVEASGGAGSCAAVDVTVEAECAALAKLCVERYGRIDVLHNNVGIGAGDRGPTHMTEEVWDRLYDANVKGAMFMCKYVLPVMRAQQSGCIINISSIAAVCAPIGILAYKTSKAALNAFTQALALGNAEYNVRANGIMPGLMETPMAIEGNVAAGRNREQVIAARHAQVPLGKHMGTGWDVANAAVFLASDEAKFITGVNLPVDGGQSARIG